MRALFLASCRSRALSFWVALVASSGALLTACPAGPTGIATGIKPESPRRLPVRVLRAPEQPYPFAVRWTLILDCTRTGGRQHQLADNTLGTGEWVIDWPADCADFADLRIAVKLNEGRCYSGGIHYPQWSWRTPLDLQFDCDQEGNWNR